MFEPFSKQEFLPASLASERQAYGDNFSERKHSVRELPPVLSVQTSRHGSSLLNQEHLKSLEEMVSQVQRSRSTGRGILKPAMKSRSRSVPSPVFRFPFQKDQGSSNFPTLGPAREIKYLRIALAARQSFLKDLRHRVHVSYF